MSDPIEKETHERLYALDPGELSRIVDYLGQEGLDAINEDQFKGLKFSLVGYKITQKPFPADESNQHPHSLSDLAMRRIALLSQEQFEDIEGSGQFDNSLRAFIMKARQFESIFPSNMQE